MVAKSKEHIKFKIFINKIFNIKILVLIEK
jgi:hypothetical protein